MNDPALPPPTATDPAPSARSPRIRLHYPWWRVALALAVAIPADGVLFFLDMVPPVGIPIDLGVGFMIWLILGRPIVLIGVLILEAIPGVGLLPFWTLVVGAIALLGMVPGRNIGDPRAAPASAIGEATRVLLAKGNTPDGSNT